LAFRRYDRGRVAKVDADSSSTPHRRDGWVELARTLVAGADVRRGHAAAPQPSAGR